MKDYAEIATQYARDVVEGRIIACKWARLACQRHLKDLERSEAGGRWVWNPELVTLEGKSYRPADRACYFIELLPHIKGDWAARAERIVLGPWQVFFVASVFGWIDRESGARKQIEGPVFWTGARRRFRIADLIVPRKNAKSTKAAGVGLYCFCADGEYGAEVYSGATSEDQAYEVFEPAKLMARKTPDLIQRFGIAVRESNLSIAETNSKFEPVIGNPGDGASPSLAIVDEYHEHLTEALYDTMRTGMGARSQALLLVITTAGDNIAGPCYAHQQELQSILEGVIEDDRRFGIIYTIDEGDDWTSETALIKANPNWGVSVDPEFMLAQQAAAIRDPRKQATFQTKHLNLWVASASPWLAMEEWKAGEDKALSLADFEGADCWLGVDLANTTDIASVCTVFKKRIDGEDHYFAFWRNYLPESRILQPESKHYQGWEKQGYLKRTSGSMIDQELIRADILADAEKFRMKEIAFDPWGAAGITASLQGDGFEVLVISLNANNLSPPMKWIDGLVKSKRLHYATNPVSTWAVNNVEVKPGHNDSWFPRKQSGSKKIDPAIALILAVARAMIAQTDEGIDGWLKSAATTPA